MPTKSNNQKKKEAEAAGKPPKKTKQQAFWTLAHAHSCAHRPRQSSPLRRTCAGERWQVAHAEEGRDEGSEGGEEREEELWLILHARALACGCIQRRASIWGWMSHAISRVRRVSL